ncbi:hypothetical protein L5515_012493 [Caenorhabditis briggsae]|uniref:PAN-3 domain-containing protein n=1 Tax=Caenorhabditis briggsae TaxID=6238 RepID=A0AAE9JHW8_CAEBR|nr:hypothetical protein L5515_012493 [Caenorhabditis briggsae]
MKMIQIFGKVTYGPFPMPFPSVNCASECFNLDYCILSWRPLSGCCYHYSYVNQPDTITFVETGKGENSIMAFKINYLKLGEFACLPLAFVILFGGAHLPTVTTISTIITGTTCPITYTEMNFTMTIPTDDTYSWKKIGNSWGLNGFRDGWTRFNRTSGISVCMKAFNVPNLWRSTALTWCEQENAIFVGMASIEESQWVHDQLDSSYNYYAYWVDGTLICSTTCNFSMLNYTDGFTTGSAALETTTNVHFVPGGNYDHLLYLGVTTLHNVSCKWPTDGFQRLACLPKAKNQKFSADSYRSRAQNSVRTKPFTVSTGHTTSERSSTDRKNQKKKKQPRATSRLDFRQMDMKREKCDENIESKEPGDKNRINAIAVNVSYSF